jgi:AcrR family transcriptional regulator
MVTPRRRGTPETPRRPGGRTARASSAILEATLGELADVGYAALSLDRVASRAGVHRSTVYRRWADKDELVVEAVLGAAARDVPAPDTGSITGDLRALTHAIVANLASPISLALLRTYVSESGRAPGIDEVARAFWDRRFALATALVQRGIDRGELDPQTDAELLIETVVAPLFLRTLVTAKPITTSYADRVVAVALAGYLS